MSCDAFVSRERAGRLYAVAMLSRLVRVGLITGLVDGLWACVLAIGIYGSTFARLWQGVASTVLGKAALQGGTRTVLIGLLMHFCVAFAWSAVFLLLVMRSALVRRALETPAGVFAVAAVYGPVIWMVMSLLVIPLLVHRPPAVTGRWWIQLIGHVFFVGLPIVAASARRR